MEASLEVNMETEDFIKLPTSSSPCRESDSINLHNSSVGPTEAGRQSNDSGAQEAEVNGEILETNEGDVGPHGDQPFLAIINDQDLVASATMLQVSIELTESTQATENGNSVHTENGFLPALDGSPLRNAKREGNHINNHEIDVTSGSKRPRMTADEPQASVHVTYNSLTRDSKQKLEELLRKWSEWHARHCTSANDSKYEMESGERTYFPALNVGLDKPSAVSFWMDNQTRDLQSKNFIPVDNSLVPLYDRAYSFGLTSTDVTDGINGKSLETVDASRCFNCGSYNHALKECPRPRDNAAVNSARKQHNSRRNRNANSRNPTRYYQNTPGGKFDGLRPGVLDTETRKLLGLGDLDPPPWLGRMREIGYPPGYLEPDDEDQPSGIRIYGEEDVKQETEDGEILGSDGPEPSIPELPKKMTVKFPGVNAPIPENADEWIWGAGPMRFELPRNRSLRRSDHSTEPSSRGYHHEQRWTRDYREDGPPGVEPGTSPSLSTFSPRYGDYDYSPSGNYSSIPRSPSFGRSLSERSRRSSLVHETSLHRETYNSIENERWTPDSLSYRKDSRYDDQFRHSRR